MLYEILKSIRNFFPDVAHQKEGEFTISNGVIAPSLDLKKNQYFLIEGSDLNDGIFQEGDELEDESFYGIVTPLKIPKEFLKLVSEIEDYQKKDQPTPYTSESFGGYSYTRAQGSSWKQAFGTRLNAWRKI